jgi:tripartite-type tricarboxylate transporter receptor subunit TctC
MYRTAAALVLAAVSTAALAQAYPSKPVRLVVPFPPAGVVDNSARAFAGVLGPAWGQSIIIENRAGANGNIGTEACAKAPADGYTICYPAGVIMTLNPVAYSKMPFDPNEFVPVVHVGVLDQAIAVNAALPVNSMNELIELAKLKPNTVTWASLGMGSTAHLYMEWLQAKTGAKFVHVPYKGSPQLLQAVIAGEVNVSTNTPAVVSPGWKSGKLKVLSVVSGTKRSPVMPDVPSFAEQGYDLDFRNWLAFWFQRGVPNDIVRRWNADINRLLADRAFVDKYITSLAVTPTGGTPEDLTAFLRRGQATATELAKIANLRFD